VLGPLYRAFIVTSVASVTRNDSSECCASDTGGELKTVSASAARRCVRHTALLLVVSAGFALTILVFYPGYITVDAQYVYAEGQAWRFGDWQSPAMAVLWRLIDPIAPGSASMFLLTAALYWASFAILAYVALRYSRWLAFFVPLIAFTPPAFFFVGLIWRDVQFGVIWLFAGTVAFSAAWASQSRSLLRAVALALISFGVLLRPNAAIAAPLLASYAMWPSRFILRRTAI